MAPKGCTTAVLAYAANEAVLIALMLLTRGSPPRRLDKHRTGGVGCGAAAQLVRHAARGVPRPAEKWGSEPPARAYLLLVVALVTLRLSHCHLVTITMGRDGRNVDVYIITALVVGLSRSLPRRVSAA